MNFRKHRPEDPEISLVPFIDVLLVVIIFLMLTTTFARLTELQLTLPAADADALQQRPQEIVVAIGADGRTLVDRQPVAGDGSAVAALTQALARAAQGRSDPVVIVSADAAAAHQSVVNVLDAARRAGLVRLTFAAQSDAPPPR